VSGLLKYEAVAVAKIPERVKEALRGSTIDENIIIGILMSRELT
jgi:hypothetical protein